MVSLESVVRLFFDLLHGIERKDVSLVNALEFAILLGYDGQLKQNSNMEKELFGCTIQQLKKMKMSKLENALIWIYFKTWGAQGQHVLDQHGLWKFSKTDLNTAITGIAYPFDEKPSERVNDLRDLIMGRFENGGLTEFYEWSKNIHNEVIETIQAEKTDSDQDAEKDLSSVVDNLIDVMAKSKSRIQKLEARNHLTVAFRAAGVKNEDLGTKSTNLDPG